MENLYSLIVSQELKEFIEANAAQQRSSTVELERKAYNQTL